MCVKNVRFYGLNKIFTMKSQSLTEIYLGIRLICYVNICGWGAIIYSVNY